jgi:uncharacterized membrane protein
MAKDSKLFAFLGVFLTVIGFLIVYATQKKDKYAMFYAKQGLIIFFLGVIISLVAIIPVIGWIISVIAWILLVIAWVIGMIYSLSDEQKDIPVIGVYAKMIKV